MLGHLILGTLVSTSTAQLLIPRQANGGTSNSYLDSVCLPAVADGQTIPPCISVSTIEQACEPNGTAAIDYFASAQCLCNKPSTFFADWIGCRECLLLHGGLSQLDFNRVSSVINIVSSTMCGANASPTGEFAAVYSSVVGAFTGQVTGATVTTDLAVSSTAVSLYYTAPGSQGTGVITGSVTAATGNGKTSGTGQTLTAKSSSTGSKTGTVAGATTSSKSNVRSTEVPAAAALALLIAGGMAAVI